MRLHASGASAFEEIEGAIDVGAVAGPGIFHRARYRRQCRNVEDVIDALASFGDFAGVAQIALDELDAVAEGGKVFPLAGFEVV